MGFSRPALANGRVSAQRFWSAITADTDEDDRAESTALIVRQLADLGREDEVSDLLRPDRNRDDVTLTVVCYEVGSITPSAIHEATSACEAVHLVSACDDSRHIASELVASNDDGIRWVAMVRADARTKFRPPTMDNTSGPDHAVQMALVRWQRESIFQSSLFDDPSHVPPTYPVPQESRTVFRTPELPGAGADYGSGPVPVVAPRNGETSTASIRAPRANGAATAAPTPGRVDQRPPADAVITNRTLQSTVRSAVAEVVPNLQRHLSEQVAALIAEHVANITPADETSRSEITEAFTHLRNEVWGLGAELEASLQAQVRTLQDEVRALRAEIDKESAIQAERTRQMSDALRTHLLQLRDAAIESRFDEVRTLVQDVARRIP